MRYCKKIYKLLHGFFKWLNCPFKFLIYFQLNFNLLGCKGCGTSAEYYKKCQLFIGLLQTRHLCCLIESVWRVRVRVCGARVLACV